MVGGRTAAALLGVASKTCSILLAAFLCSYRQTFSLAVLLASMLVYPYSSIDTIAAWKEAFHFIGQDTLTETIHIGKTPLKRDIQSVI